MGVLRRMAVLLPLAVGMLAAPAAAEAWSIHRYTVRDAGPSIVHKVTVCRAAPPGYERKFHFTAYSESATGEDGGSVHRYNWLDDSCWRIVVEHNDDLEYTGRYFGRMRIRNGYTGEVRWTSWRAFWSS